MTSNIIVEMCNWRTSRCCRASNGGRLLLRCGQVHQASVWWRGGSKRGLAVVGGQSALVRGQHERVQVRSERFDFAGEFPLVTSHFCLFVCSAADEAWRLLSWFLSEFPSPNGLHHRQVLVKLLSHGVPPPDWLVKSYKVRPTNVPSSCLAQLTANPLQD